VSGAVLPARLGSAISDASEAAPSLDRPSPRRSMMFLGVALPLALALGWEIAVWSGLAQGRLVPPPSRIFAALAGLAATGELWLHVSMTLSRVAGGFLLGAGAGIALGSLSGLSGIARRLLDPTLQALRSIPSIAWVPLFILWLGIFEASKVALIAVGVFFPIYLGVAAAILSVDRKLVEVGRAFRLSRADMLRRVYLPAVLPETIVSLRSGLGLGFMFVVAAEFMGASEGLGYLLVDGQQMGRTGPHPRGYHRLRAAGQDGRRRAGRRDAAVPALAGHRSRAALMLSVEALSKTYADGTEALRSLSFDVGSSEIVALVGGSGCGKTTFLRLAAGLDRPSRGAIRLDGEPVSGPHPGIGIVFQEPRLLPWRSVADNVGLGLGDVDGPERARRVAHALDRVGLADHAQRWPRELSGGQQQRVAIARAFVTQPRVLLLDEPFSALDPFTRASLHGHLMELWAESRPVVLMVTHDVHEAVSIADRVLVMRPHPGRIDDDLPLALARPRNGVSPAVEASTRRVLAALDRSMKPELASAKRSEPSGGALWW
jgi:sulfonate transport system ATP-binding protein